MPGLAPPPGWKPAKSEPQKELKPPPAFKLQKTEQSNGLAGAKERGAASRSQKKRKRRRNVPPRFLNPDRLRAIIEKHRDMGAANANADKKAYIGALKYLPHAIFKLLENMPQPWESKKLVNVLYHTAGAITFVEEMPVIDPVEYMAMWGQMWNQMRDEKRDRTMFRRMRQPSFDDEEIPLTWKDLNSMVADIPEPIPAARPASVFHAYNTARPFLLQREPPAGFDFASFVTAKALQTQIPNGPRFEEPHGDTQYSNPGSLEDPQRIIVRPREFPVRVETRVMFPNLYGPPEGDIILPRFPEPVNAVIQRHDNLKPFFLDTSVTAIRDSDKFSSSTGFTPFFDDVEIDQNMLAQSLACYHAPYPFNQVKRKDSRAQDVALVKQMYTQRRPLRVMASKTRRSYQRLVKAVTKNSLRRAKSHHTEESNKSDLLKILGSTAYFERTKIEWLEAGIQLCHQGYQILQLLIHRRGLHFMHLDYNFNLKPTKTLTTKERKRSRFGNSFHLTRELLKMIKLLVDSHIQFRLGNIDAFELADGIHYIFTHLGQLTGIYRYKYRVMHQITACNDIKHVIYDRFNMDGVGKGPGCGVWQPAWRIWLAFLRGSLPLLERWLGNLISRQFFGRVSKGIAKTVTKQRIDSHYDLELRAAVLHDILDVIPEQLRKSKTRVVMQHLSEAWRCWKANIPWDVPGMPPPVKKVIDRYVKSRAEHWIKVTQTNRERIRAGGTVDKAVARKNLGRMTRLWLRAEQQRQSSFAEEGPFVTPQDAVLMFKTMAAYLHSRNFTEPIDFPSADGYANDTKLLTLALEQLRNEYNMTARLTNTQREELAQIEQAYDNPYDTISDIKKTLMSKRVFKNVEVSLLDFHSHLCPVYHIDASEKIVDAYLDQYLWYEAEKRGLFPSWVKPSDDEVAPMMVRKFCENINNSPRVWSVEEGERSSILHLKLSKFVDNADLTLLNQLLQLIVDKTLADYITAKMNSSLSYKDMSHIQQVGIIRGFQFSSFVVQYYLLMVDVLFLGLSRATALSDVPAGSPGTTADDDDGHPIRGYMRNVEDIYIVTHFGRREADELMSDYAVELRNDVILPQYPLKKCWPPDRMMRLVMQDVQFGRALFEEFRNRVPEVLGSVYCEDASVYSSENPALMFEVAGFEVRLAPRRRFLNGDPAGMNYDAGEEDEEDEDAMWLLNDSSTGERTATVSLRVSDESINRFANRVRQILMSSGSTTFAKIIKRWNTALTSLATYFREAAVATPRLLDVIVKNEARVQNKVKMGLNSKMPARFPPCVFYSPEEVGGLGMLSASHILIPDNDLYGNTKQFRHGIQDSASEEEESLIPNLFRYINTWDSEAADSQRVWKEYAQKRADAINTNSRVSIEDLEDIWDRGLPRISTLFQRDKSILAFDKGFRARQAFKNYASEKYDPFWWVNARHDGRLWNFTNYRSDVVEALGGIRRILEHTLFKATGFEDWEGLFWQKQSGFEQQMQLQKLTNAQRAGLSQIPNRRFTLWWSPTINRANVYVGFLVQLDLTGIFLHGKIPTLKISYIQIFRAHLWQKIHESLVLDMCRILDREQSILAIDTVEKLSIHPRKSYRMNASSADILLTAANGGNVGWALSKPSLLGFDNDTFDNVSTTQFWIDIQLRYGDYDSHDVSRYTRAKFLDYTSDGVSLYPSKTGLMICVDLAYNTYDAYGYWFPGLKQLIKQAMNKLMQSNAALYILRERIRKALQLYQSQPRQPHLNADNFVELLEGNSLIVDDSAVYRVTTRKTKNGNMTSKPINGALMAVNPHNGLLHMSLINAETAWAGQKKLSAVSKWKAAEVSSHLLRSMPSEDMPNQIVINSRGLRDPMEVNMLEFPGVTVRSTEFSLAFSSLLRLPKFRDVVDNAAAPATPNDLQLHAFNLYDDWLSLSQASTAFSRLMLLIRGLTVDLEATKTVLAQVSGGRPPPDGYIWPKLQRDEWVLVEDRISDIIVDDYSQKNGVNRQSLTQTEIRDIILGQSVSAPSEERQRRELEGNGEANSSGSQQQATAQTTKTHNIHGEEITVVTTSKYEQQTFESKGTWRQRALDAASSLHYRSLNLDLAIPKKNRSLVQVMVPRNIVRDFITASDVRNLVIGILYGTRDNYAQVVNITSIAVVPQLGSATNISFSPTPDPGKFELPDAEGLEILGVIRSETKPRADGGVSPIDLGMLSSRMRSDNWEPTNMVVLVANYQSGTAELQCFEPTAKGVEWGGTNRDLLSENPNGYAADEFALSMETVLSEDEGYFYVPHDDTWNFSFMNTRWNANIRPIMKIGQPIPFYDSLHRPIHFARVGKLEDAFDVDDEVF